MGSRVLRESQISATCSQKVRGMLREDSVGTFADGGLLFWKAQWSISKIGVCVWAGEVGAGNEEEGVRATEGSSMENEEGPE